MYTNEDARADGRADYLADHPEERRKYLTENELSDIIFNFVRICEKTAEYDKCGESYYVAKRWIKTHEHN
jgi:hypothetical protein